MPSSRPGRSNRRRSSIITRLCTVTNRSTRLVTVYKVLRSTVHEVMSFSVYEVTRFHTLGPGVRYLRVTHELGGADYRRSMHNCVLLTTSRTAPAMAVPSVDVGQGRP